MIDQLTIEKILSAANIVEVVQDYVTLHRRGVNHVGLCPFHNEKTPSFYVSASKGICKCFSCGKGGNAIHFLMEHEQVSFFRAAEMLAKKYGIQIEQRELTKEEQILLGERESMFIINQFASEFFQDTLLNSPLGRAVGLAYLRGRGFRDDIIKKFALGYSPDESQALLFAAREGGYKEELLIKTGLCYATEGGEKPKDRFRGRIIFPIHSLSGRIVGFGGRIMQSNAKTAKYVNSPESVIYSKNKELYGLYFAKQAIIRKDRCFLVEGYADVISMVQAGVENVVASCGTSLTQGQIQLIHRFSSHITVLYDGDMAGIKASVRGIDMLLAEGMNVKVVLLPNGEDPDSFSRKLSSEAFQNYLEENQVDFIRFKLQLLSGDSQNDPMARAALIKEITHSISVIQDPIVRSVYIKECGWQLQMEESLLINEVNRAQRERLENENRNRATANRQLQQSQEPGQEKPQDTTVQEQEGSQSEVQNDNRPEPEQPAQEQEVGQRSAEELLKDEIRLLKSQGRRSIMEKERGLARLLVRYGERPLTYADNGMDIVCVGEYILNELDKYGLEFCHPIYNLMFREYSEHASQPGFVAEKYFLSFPDSFISLTAAALLEERYQLSEVFKESRPATDEERVAALTERLMDEYMLEMVKFELKETEKEMKNPDLSSDPEHFMEVQECFRDLLKARNDISKRLGHRVVNL